LWTVSIVQSKHPEPAFHYFNPDDFPSGAISSEVGSPFKIFEWEIETLSNEILTVPHRPILKDGATKRLKWFSYSAALECARALRGLENFEFRKIKKSEDITIELGRIAARQFNWQIGYANVAQVYRNLYIYSQQKSSDFFLERYGISIEKFVQTGFAIFAMLLTQPVASYGPSWDRLGISKDDYNRTVSRLATPVANHRKIARFERAKVIHTSDKPSSLRKFPCILFGDENERIRAPLPELIIERITSGLFYDLADAAGDVKDEYGRAFESYCYEYLISALPGLNWRKEKVYKSKGKQVHSPDIICVEREVVRLIIECKATRMSHEAKFGLSPLKARGYSDLTKAVLQIWRYRSNCRLGITGDNVSPSCVGLVLTLDDWLVMSDPLQRKVLADAHEIRRNKERNITEDDAIEVQFVTVREMERALTVLDEHSIFETIEKMQQDSFFGWRIDVVARSLFGEGRGKKSYPFREKVGELLPWWDSIGKHVDS
jgi:hypothetical protein